ncbi:MAG TPA: (Fe-S)-binding protein [Acidimicrobiales bacterium]|nr:(Fe-S)-binding protein [Acidimicrobiales bacterium]
MRVSLLITCVVDVVAPDVGEAAVRLLRAAGCDVSCNLAQTCCGQPAWNAGFADDAARVARTTLDALDADLEAGAEAVVVPAGSCATMVRLFWPELFEVAGDHEAAARARRVGERTRELSELLAERADRLPPLRLHRPVEVALHESCHMLRELRIADQPRTLAAGIDGCEVTEWDGSDRCCGFGGTFSVKLPEASVAMADEKLAALDAGAPAADLLVGCDSSCLLHLQARAEATGRPLHVRHLAEVLAAALPDDAGDAP